jgi:hypothetical protein
MSSTPPRCDAPIGDVTVLLRKIEQGDAVAAERGSFVRLT